MATSLIAEYFSAELRGSAISVYNWGIYTGYSLSFAIGNQILKHLVTIINCFLSTLNVKFLNENRTGVGFSSYAEYQDFLFLL